MIDNIELLESLIYNEPSQSVLDGLACIHLCLNVAVTGNEDLIKLLN